MIKLSICIPTRNRSNTLFTNLKRICKYSNTNSQFIEVVIGDNSDKSSIKSVKEIFKDHSEIKFNYIYNSTNIGLARNYLNIVKNALGEFCWILGDDDFIKENSISTLLKIIDSKKYDLIAFNYEVIKIIKDDNPSVISKKIELKKDMYSNEKFGKSFKSNNFFDLISYKFNNVYLGSMMTFIFSTKVWNKYYASPETKRDYNFNNLFGIYPHVYILANYFSDSKIFYYDQPLVIVGEGLRDWSNETNNNYWMSDLVLIHKKVLIEILKEYRKNGMPILSFLREFNRLSQIVGNLAVILRWFDLKKKNYKHNKSRNLKKIHLLSFLMPCFYVGLLKGFILIALNKAQNYNSN